MATAPAVREQALPIAVGGETLSADVTVPRDAIGLVIFAHGSGSSRLSPRNRQIAQWLNDARLATLLLDLLSEREEAIDRTTAEYRFDIPRLAQRLAVATDWAAEHEATATLPVSYFGASTGAAAALMAAAERPGVRAVVSRGGRADMAGNALATVESPSLLIVGGNDPEVIELNRSALERLGSHKRLEIVPGATHLFEEPGALEQVGELARRWLADHLGRTA